MASSGDAEVMLLPPCEGDTLEQAALKVLRTPDPWKKVEFGDMAARLWTEGSISLPYDPAHNVVVLDKPARSSIVKVVAPQYMPKLGKAGSLHSRQALLHSLVHTESWAVDLAWDIIARFGRKEAMPRAFFDDFVRVAEDEGRHFKLLEARLKQLGSFYGAFPVHDGLWDSAAATSNELDARLAVEHCVHEARGLDVIPTTISRFRKGGDEESANLLELVVYPEEITHCAAGVRWFTYLFFRSHPLAMCIPIIEEQQHESGNGVIDKLGLEGSKSLQKNEDVGFESLIAYFHVLVKKCFRGPLKPPFNEWARLKAGFGPEWYVPLSQK